MDLRKKRKNLELRAQVLRSIRAFFEEKDFLEVDTPIRIPAPALEEHIDAVFSEKSFLRTSPELHMKRLLAAGYSRIFQMGPCFRREEQGRIHHPEFTLLEWYRAESDEEEILADTQALLQRIVSDLLARKFLNTKGLTLHVKNSWVRMTVREAFSAFAGWDPVANFEADRFDLDLVEKVEPSLPQDVPVVLCDYPVEAAAFAECRLRDGVPVAARWELYWGGVELANAYGELVDAAEQRRRFEEIRKKRERAGRVVYPLDEAFLEALEQGMPASGGIALGVDRLVMLLAGAEGLDEVTAFLEA